MTHDDLSIRDEVALDIQPANELEVERKEVDGVRFITIRAFGEPVEILERALEEIEQRAR